MDIYNYYITPEEYIIASNNGISRDLVNKRVRSYGWNKLKAITIAPKPVKKYSKEIIELAESNGISIDVFYSRVKYGWSQERAATELINSREEIISKMAHLKRSKSEVSL